MLDQVADRSMTVIVVWEPVLLTDLAPPTTTVMSRVHDRRVRQFWDPERSLSEYMVQAAIADPSLLAPGDSISPATIVWDFVAVFPSGAVLDPLTKPAYYGGTVESVMAEVRSTLAALRESEH